MEAVMLWAPVAVLLSGLVAGAVVFAMTHLAGRRLGEQGKRTPGSANCFLLRDGRVIDHDAGAEYATTWPELRQWLGTRFPTLPARLPDLKQGESRRYPAGSRRDGGHVTIAAVRRGGHRVTLGDPSPATAVERHESRMRLARDRIFRKALDAAPCVICVLGSEGEIEWRNHLFGAFGKDETTRIVSAAGEDGGAPDEPVRLSDPLTGQDRYFDLTVEPLGAQRVVYAQDVTRLVQADAMRISFVQTLTKTFAGLATGLIVFDRRQRLVLFNPAMIDLTGLPAEFLSTRPGVMEFFDRLRDNQVLPEPKSYATWRSQINEMIETATDGHYSEAWSLPSGLTYRVTGRPHPDGAIAFLFEDISDEISLSRRSRTQLEIRQAVLDRIGDAVAVTGPNRVLVFCNRAFRELLGFDPDNSFAETGFDDLVALCRKRLPDEAFWARVAAASGRSRIEAHLPGGPGGPVCGKVLPLPGGFTMLHLSPAPTETPVSA